MDPLTTTDPERIDEYTLEGRLGAGGYGVVYAGTDAEGRRVALKVLRPELADNPGLKERLAREGKALGRVGGDRHWCIHLHDRTGFGQVANLVRFTPQVDSSVYGGNRTRSACRCNRGL